MDIANRRALAADTGDLLPHGRRESCGAPQAIEMDVGRPESAASGTPVPRRPRVLVADDHPANLRRALALLSLWDITPAMVADGAQAAALACRTRFDVILMDLVMPVTDGLSAALQIRRFERENRLSRCSIVAYTSAEVAWSVLRNCGMDGLLAKPCNALDFQECLQRFCPWSIPVWWQSLR